MGPDFERPWAPVEIVGFVPLALMPPAERHDQTCLGKIKWWWGDSKGKERKWRQCWIVFYLTQIDVGLKHRKIDMLRTRCIFFLGVSTAAVRTSSPIFLYVNNWWPNPSPNAPHPNFSFNSTELRSSWKNPLKHLSTFYGFMTTKHFHTLYTYPQSLSADILVCPGAQNVSIFTF